ncbi:MAG: SURF1 family protein [Phenylobacterium sp.]
MTRRFPLGLTIATAIALSILLALGVWQLERLAWKQGVLRRVAALEQAAPIPLETALALAARGEDVDFRRVRAECQGLDTAPWLELYAIDRGQAGSRLISACRLAQGPYGAVLVDRGFVADTISARPPRDVAGATPVPVAGVLRAPDKASPFAPANSPQRWFRRDVPEMARALGAVRPAPVFLYAETSTNPQWLALKPIPVPREIPNRHLEYALTWFGLAGALLAVYLAMLFRRWKA